MESESGCAVALLREKEALPFLLGARMREQNTVRARLIRRDDQPPGMRLGVALYGADRAFQNIVFLTEPEKKM
jgi:hypothetical protein